MERLCKEEPSCKSGERIRRFPKKVSGLSIWTVRLHGAISAMTIQTVGLRALDGEERAEYIPQSSNIDLATISETFFMVSFCGVVLRVRCCVSDHLLRCFNIETRAGVQPMCMIVQSK